MIHLSNQHSFEYITASGALAYDGQGWPWEWPLRWLGFINPPLFTHVTKTLTYAPKEGNLRWSHPWSCVKTLKGGVVNAIGLTNPGLDWWVSKISPAISRRKTSIICSITEENPKKLAEMIDKLNPLSIKGIEFNASCPNTDQELLENREKVIELVETIHKNSAHPLILKLSVHQDYLKIVQSAEQYVEAFSINSVPWKIAFPNQLSPLASLGGGGVSGQVAQKWTWKMVQDISSQTKVPVIGPGVWEKGDIQKLRELGAKAISFGSIFMRYPWRPTRLVKELSRG